MPYQPLWRNGRARTGGERDCADRYELIHQQLSRLDQAFTVLDIGAAEGYFTARIAEDFDAYVDAIDTNPRLAELSSERIRVHRHRTTPGQLADLPRHDVVLALSVLHHFPDWQAALDRIRQCRQFALIEVPDPGEGWMRRAASRHQLSQIHNAVRAVSTRMLGTFTRTGRDGSVHHRPLYLVPGTVTRATGRVFAGSGTNSRKMPAFSQGLDLELGYAPRPGSLNLRMDDIPPLGPPALDWNGTQGKRHRDYQFWDAWIDNHRLHAMVPGERGHGEDCLELVSPRNLRAQHGLSDNDEVTMDYEPASGLLHLDTPTRTLHMWDTPGKIAKCWKSGNAYEKPLLDHIYAQHYTGRAIDAGANIGNHTLWLAGTCSLYTVAFEPLYHAALARNVTLNELDDAVRIEPVALGDCLTTATHQGKGRLTPGQGQLRVLSLDHYEFTDVSVIKIDIEGMEPDMLRGAEKTIAASHPDIYVEEWGSSEHDAIAAVLGPWGYTMTKRFSSKGSPTPMGLWQHREDR